MSSHVPKLLVVAHGTESAAGLATITRLVTTIADARPDVAVDLAFLDVADPRLSDVLTDRPTIVVPALLSTGYHVQSDIPAIVRTRPDVVVGRHLGPDPRLVDVLVDRLPRSPGPTVLVAAGSSRPEARVEVESTGAALADRIGAPVEIRTMADDLDGLFAQRGTPFRIATYLLAEGRFTADLARAAAGRASVAAPLGVHPALVDLVWARYDDAHGGDIARAAVG